MDRYHYAKLATERKKRQRARDSWRQWRYEGWESLEELLESATVESWQGKAHRDQMRELGITADDLPPSRKAVETMIENLPQRKN